MVTTTDAALLRQAANDRHTPKQMVVAYDRRSDTLLVHFYGRGLPAVSVPVGDDDRDLFYIRVDPKTHRPLGIQIEGFMASFITEHPELDMLLDIAELRGTTSDEIQGLRVQRATAQAERVLSRFLEAVASR